jgi:hypothetical protein
MKERTEENLRKNTGNSLPMKMKELTIFMQEAFYPSCALAPEGYLSETTAILSTLSDSMDNVFFRINKNGHFLSD